MDKKDLNRFSNVLRDSLKTANVEFKNRNSHIQNKYSEYYVKFN